MLIDERFRFGFEGIIPDRDGPVAQLVRAPPCHGGGRGFESHPGRLWDLSSAGRASALQAEGHRFEPYRSHCSERNTMIADVAQLAEQLICNQQVIGSSPIIGFGRNTIWMDSRVAKGDRL